MATPKIVTDGDSEFEEAITNKYIAGDGTKVQIKVWYATVVYDSGSLVVSTANDACGFVTGDFAYNTSTDELHTTLAGFVNAPQVQLTRLDPGSNYVPALTYVDETEIKITFYDPTDLSSQATPGAVDANMNFNVLVIGY